VIETINPDYIIPIYKKNPTWFSGNFDNVNLSNEREELVLCNQAFMQSGIKTIRDSIGDLLTLKTLILRKLDALYI